MIQTALAKLLTVKIAAATIAATTLGGVALAASTGTLPTPGGDEHRTKPAPSHSTADPAGSRGGSEPSASANAERAGDSSADPSPSMVGLCGAYVAQPMDSRGKALDGPAFTALVTAAGGKAGVTEYCTTVLAAASTAAKSHPTGKPATAPTTPPSQGPADTESTHPTGPPTAPGKADPSARPAN